jgi:hypothetical protein
MKIIAEYLVILPIFKGCNETKLYKVVQISGTNTQFYRESWNKGNVRYELVDEELFHEQNSKEILEN